MRRWDNWKRLGRRQRAGIALEPDYTIDSNQMPVTVFKRPKDNQHLFEGMRKRACRKSDLLLGLMSAFT